MPIVGAVMGAIAIGGALASAFAGGAAKKDVGYQQAALTDTQAALTQEQVEEENRREQIQAMQAGGMARSRVGASGFASGYAPGQRGSKSTMSIYADAFSKELASEVAYNRRIGMQKVDLLHQSANVQRSAADAGLTGDILGGVAGFASGTGQLIKSVWG